MKHPINPNLVIDVCVKQASEALVESVSEDESDSIDDIDTFLEGTDFDLEFIEPEELEELEETYQSLSSSSIGNGFDVSDIDIEPAAPVDMLQNPHKSGNSDIPLKFRSETPKFRSETQKEFGYLLGYPPRPNFEQIFNKRFASVLFSKPALQPEKPTITPSDYEKDAFILAYRDARSSSVHTLHAEADDDTSIGDLLEGALGFFDRNCGFTDFKAHWVADSAARSIYQSNVRFVTAFHKDREQREVIACSARSDYYLSRSVRDKESDQFTIFDIGLAIEGLIITGSLNYYDAALEPKDCPRIVIAQLSSAFNEPSDMEYIDLAYKTGVIDRYREDIDYTDLVHTMRASYMQSRKPQRFISKVFSNDPFYTRVSSKRNGGTSFDYSTNAHKSRWNSIKANVPDIPPLAPCASAKLWLYGSDCYNGWYFKHRKKDVIQQDNLRDSLILTNEFLGLYFKVSNRGFSLSIRDIKGVVDACQVALYQGPKSGYVDFTPPTSVDINVGAAGFVFKRDQQSVDVVLADLIFEGWFVDVGYTAWNPDHFYHEKTKGDINEIISHWLWVMLADQLFTNDEKKPRYIGTSGSATSKRIKKAMVYTSFKVSDVVSVRDNNKGRFVGVGSNDTYYSYEPLQVTSFEVAGLSFKVGKPLFEVHCKEVHASQDSYWSLFLSSEGEGFFNHSSTPSYTLLKASALGDVKAVYCFASIGSALKKLISILLETDRVQRAGMDQFDVTRSLINTARAFGCVIDVDFSFMSSRTQWDVGDAKYD